MATGAVFQLINNDGKQDRMLMATALLNKRLRLVENARAADDYVSDPTPTLLDIERTHVLFVNAHFKPFAAVGFEYNKTPQSAGNAVLGGQLQFSIQQFGDFFSDMAIYLELSAPTITIDASISATYNTTSRENAPAFRWCSYIGERIFKRVSFDVNGNPLDYYTREVYNFYREYCLTPTKEVGYNRMMGQEAPLEGYLRQSGIDRTGATDGATGLSNGGAGPQSSRFKLDVLNGNQTPRDTDNAAGVALLVPLLFWFNLDPRLAIPSVSIPYGQRYITVEFADQSELVGLVPRGTGTWTAPLGSIASNSVTINIVRLYTNNIFVNPEIHDIFIRRIGFTLIRVHRIQKYNSTKTEDEIQLQQFKWPIETIYVGMKPSPQETSQRFLDRWHKFSASTISAHEVYGVGGGSFVQLTGTSAQVGAIAAGVSAITGIGTAFSTQVSPGDIVNIAGHYGVVQATPAPTATTMTIFPGTTAIAAQTIMEYCQRPVVEAESSVPTFTRISVKAHGIPLYNDFESLFYNSYQAWAFGSHNIRTPKDVGSLMVNFCLYPKTYQPSGYVNISRAREFFFNWTSAVVGVGGVTGTFYALGIAINFLLVSDGSAVLRYST